MRPGTLMPGAKVGRGGAILLAGLVLALIGVPPPVGGAPLTARAACSARTGSTVGASAASGSTVGAPTAGGSATNGSRGAGGDGSCLGTTPGPGASALALVELSPWELALEVGRSAAGSLGGSAGQTHDDSAARFSAVRMIAARMMRRGTRGPAGRRGGGPELSTCCPRGPPGAA